MKMDFSSVDKEHYLQTWDYIIIATMLTMSAGIGLYYGCTGGKQKTTSEFFLANKSMGIFPTALSLYGSMANATAILGPSSDVFFYDITIWYFGFACLITMPITAYFFIPLFFRLELLSVYEYLEKRFDKNIRRLGSFLFIAQSLMFSALALYTPSLAVSQVTGLDLWTSIISLGIVCIFYTALGGIKAVMWTDVLQVLIMFGCLFLIIILSVLNLGGFQYVWSINIKGNRIHYPNLIPDPLSRLSFWSCLIGGSFPVGAFYAVNQAFLQRYLATSSIKKAQKALWCNIILISTVWTLSVIGGCIAYAAYWNCDPLQSGRIKKPDQIFPLFVMDMFSSSPGIPGLFIACCFSGTLSTVSSNIQALSSVIMNDYVKLKWKNLSDSVETWVSKIFTVCFGVIVMLLVAITDKMDSVVSIVLNITGVIGGPLLGLMSLGLFFPSANTIGAGIGGLLSIILGFWIATGSQINKPHRVKNFISTDGCKWNQTFSNFSLLTNVTIFNDVDTFPLYKISHMWYGAISCFTVILIGLLASYLSEAIFKKKTDRVDDLFLSPIVHKRKKVANELKD